MLPAEYLNELRATRRQLREKHPSQRCIVDVQINPAQVAFTAGVLDNSNDLAIIRFTNNGKFVHSYYTVICNNSYNPGILVGVNHTPLYNNPGNSGTGIWITGGALSQTVILKSQIQYLVIRLADHANTGEQVLVNSHRVGNDGMIQIYGWTLPEDGQVNGLH